jgi:hypothetical protein
MDTQLAYASADGSHVAWIASFETLQPGNDSTLPVASLNPRNQLANSSLRLKTAICSVYATYGVRATAGLVSAITTMLDICRYFDYKTNFAPSCKEVVREASRAIRGEGGARGRRCKLLPGGSGITSPGTMTGTGGAPWTGTGAAVA